MSATAGLPKLDNTFGVLLIGIIVATALWGIAVAQCWWYYITYQKDPVSLKLFIFITWVWDTVHQALICHLIYYFLIQNFFNPVGLDHHVWSLVLQSLFEALTCVFVQGYFVYRIWILSQRSFMWPLIPALFVAAKFVVSLAYVAEAYKVKSITIALFSVHGLSVVMNGLAAAGDIVIAAIMTYLLWRSRSGYAATDSIIMKLMAYTINTGIATALAAIVALILATALPGSPIYGAIYFITGKIYMNTMMGSLNARNSIARGDALHSLEREDDGPAYRKYANPKARAAPGADEGWHCDGDAAEKGHRRARASTFSTVGTFAAAPSSTTDIESDGIVEKEVL